VPLAILHLFLSRVRILYLTYQDSLDMPEQSSICQCGPFDDDGHVESKIETASTSSSSLIDYNSKSSLSTNKRSNKSSNHISSLVVRAHINLAAIGERGVQAGCHSAAATVDGAFQSVDHVFESAVDLLIPNTACITGDLCRESKQPVNPEQDDHTIEVDYNGTLHTIVSGSSKSGKDDEIIVVPEDKGSKQRANRSRNIGRFFRQKRDSNKAAPVHYLTTATPSQRAPKPVSPPPVAAPTRQRPITTVSLLDKSTQQNTWTRRDASNDAVVLRSFGDKPQHVQPKQQQQQKARALKIKSVNQATGATNERNKQTSSWWGKNKKKQLSKKHLETRRYVHEEEEAIQEGDTNVLMIRMHRTPTNCMVPQTR
jgi:hypothetical protein